MAAMLSLPSLISARLCAVAGIDPELRPATRPQFGHYQSNVALRLANAERTRPRDVAARIVEQAEVSDLCEPLEIAGPGFINIRIKPSVLAKVVSSIIADPDAGVNRAESPETVVIDYSSPNVAKQMHVGHLRSTIIGDCFRRVLLAQGHDVIAANHIGDWGTQFGMLVQHIVELGIDVSSLTLDEAAGLYREANTHFQDDPDFAERARNRVVALQSGDPETRAIWQLLIDVSKAGFNQIYSRLDVLLTDDDLMGESQYNDLLAGVVADLEDSGVAVIDDGALCVFLSDDDAPLIVRKRDGGFGYSATDLAAVRYRVGTLHADRLIYVVGAPQAHHFEQVFAVARQVGWLPEGVSAEHVAFGQILGDDGRPFKTRDGSTVTLTSLLDAAEEVAARPIAIAAVKYADLSNSLHKDYTFAIERMVATTGNTGPYLQYAHARVSGILRKAEAEGIAHSTVRTLTEPAEHTVAVMLSRFGEAVDEVAESLQPHKLCSYLFDLATALSVFYEQCPVLKSEGDIRASRLALCEATQKVLAKGLGLLGIEAPQRM
jgi:arginyl-tRNA synthetase